MDKSEKFHPLRVYCPECKKGAVILDVQFSIKGSVKIKLSCVFCAQELTLNTSWDKIICYCAENELTKATVFEGTSTMQ